MNRQVPKVKRTLRYSIIGDGKVAHHISHYFDLLNIDYNCWSRKQMLSALPGTVASSDVVLLLIADSAIETFVQDKPFLLTKKLVHFSGSLYSEDIAGCHPLMAFARNLYDLDVYTSMPFVCDQGVNFNNLFPQLPNQWFAIEPAQKVFYHAMCVMAGNFSQLLMQQTAKELHNKLSLTTDILSAYLLQNTKNFISNPKNSATGPLQRGDFTTIDKHIHVLQQHPLSDIYHSFVQLYRDLTLQHPRD